MPVKINYEPNLMPHSIKSNKIWKDMGFVKGSFVIDELDYKKIYEIEENQYDTLDKNEDSGIIIQPKKEIELSLTFLKRGKMIIKTDYKPSVIQYIFLFYKKKSVNVAIIDNNCGEIIEHIKFKIN